MTNFDTVMGGGAILRLTVYEASQNTGANQSTDNYVLSLIKGAYASYDLVGTTYSFNINGTTGSGSFTFDFRTTTSQTIANGPVTVTHNADGTKTISCSGTIGSTGTGIGGPATASGTFTQTPILGSTPAGGTVARLSHTLTQPLEHLALATTEALALGAVQATAAEITLATLPTNLSSSPISLTPSGSALDAFNDVLRTEQGTIYSTTTGTLLAPVQSLTVRERTRPTTITASWDVERELDGAPEFVRDITNMVSTITTDGPTQSVVVTDQTLTARVGSANTSESILNTGYADLLAWGQDRLQRGANVQLRLASVTIDAMTTPTDRTADLLALKPGDRHQFTNLPSQQLGFSTWDGWLLGVDETHTLTEHKFTLFFAPVLPATAIYDTNYFMADGALTLTSSLTAGATSMSVTTTETTVLLETATFPYTLIIDSEQVTVTACTSAEPQVATITRGVNGTTAASHSAGAVVEVAVSSLYAL